MPIGAATIDTRSGDVANVAPEEFTGPAPAPGPPPAQLVAPPSSAPTGSGVWAAIIGIDDYPGRSHDLRAAVNDANDTDQALARYGAPPDQRLRLGGGAATAANLRRSLEWLTAHAGPDATAVFFFAGHVRKSKGHEVLVAADGGTVSDTEVADLLRPLRARKAWIVIAGCYGGGFTEVLAPGRILTGAAPANQLAYESPSIGRSYLVEYVIRRAMLQGEADGSVEAAFAWGVAAIRRDHPNRAPVQFDDLAGELSLGIPIRPPVSPPASRSTSTPAGQRSSAPPTTTTTAPPRKQSCIVQLGSAVRCGS